VSDAPEDHPLPRGEVWLVRHAETDWSRDGRHTGRADVPLTDAGRVSARALADRLRGHAFAAVHCSPLGRARETAALAGIDLGAARAVLDEDLLEWDYGAYEGRTTPEIRERAPGWFLWRDGCPGGESPADVGARADRVIAAACAVDGDVLLVAHGHLLRVLAARWTSQAPAAGAHLMLETGAIGVLGQERRMRAIRRWNG
jgi:probable phosphoglycerate mutase